MNQITNYENSLKPKIVCGVDEAGRGPLAGPVVAAAVILDADNIPEGLNDSKKLSEKNRNILFSEIMKYANVAIATVSAAIIDEINIRNASLLAMEQATRQLEIEPDYALIDGNAIPNNMPCESQEIIKGDQKCLSIAAASIIAKVTRDNIMINVHNAYPIFDFCKHKGYPTKHHRDILKVNEPCPIHRNTFTLK